MQVYCGHWLFIIEVRIVIYQCINRFRFGDPCEVNPPDLRAIGFSRSKSAGIESPWPSLLLYRKKEEETGKKTGDGNNESKPEEKWPDVTVNEDLYIQFSPAGNYKMRFAKGSSDLLVRAGAPRRGLDVNFRNLFTVLYFLGI